MDKNTYNIYFQNIQRGRFDRPFVDAALSLGDQCTSSADSLDWDVCGAAEYYSRARFVAQMMLVQSRDAKDKSLLEKAERSISLLLKERPIKPESKVTWADISCLFEGFCESDTLSAQVAPLDDNTFRLSFTTTDEKKMFICIPSLDICGLYSAFSVVAKPFSPQEFVFIRPDFTFDKVCGNVFYSKSEKLLSCGICNFEISKAD